MQPDTRRILGDWIKKVEKQTKENPVIIDVDSYEEEDDEFIEYIRPKKMQKRKQKKVFNVVYYDQEDVPPMKIIDRRGPIAHETQHARVAQATQRTGPFHALHNHLDWFLDMAHINLQNANWKEQQEKERIAALEFERKLVEDQARVTLKSIIKINK